MKDIRAKFGHPNFLQSPDIRQNSDRAISDFEISSQSFIKKNCHKSRTSNDIDMKPGPATKDNKKLRQRQKKLKMTSCQKIVMSLSFFWFMVNLEQFRSWIPEAWPNKLTFSLIVTFYLRKTVNKATKSLMQLSYYCFE